MKAFVRVTALALGFGNGYALLGRVPGGLGAYSPTDLSIVALIVAAAALLTAEVALRVARGALEGAFLDRYAALVATACLGGSLCGGGLALSGLAYDASLGRLGLIGFSAVACLWGLLWGGVLGLLEGAVFGLPLSGLLGLWRVARGGRAA